MSLFCNIDELVTESDVEQKLIFPLLTSIQPNGLGIPTSQIKTKEVLRRVEIGKRQTKKYYYPDYVIVIRGVPLLVVEAKNPDVGLEDAYAEARLYATEINAGFPHKVNLCKYVLVCNGKEIWAGYYDSANPVVKVSFDEIYVENVNYAKLINFCSISVLSNTANDYFQMERGNKKFLTPVSDVGSRRAQNAEMEENSFGRLFVLENKRILDPETESQRAAVVENAYIKSAKREQHIDPIYKEIKRFQLPSAKHVTPLGTDSPVELKDKIAYSLSNDNEEYSLMLLIGNVGSGKTTFVRYFQRVFLKNNDNSLAEKCSWIFINMNMAPLNREEIYSWVKHEIKEYLIKANDRVDFTDLNVIKTVFRKDIQNFENGIGGLLGRDTPNYRTELYNLLKEKIENEENYIRHICLYLKEQKGILPIVVLDNSDKRTREDQLLMFQVAQWLRSTFKCIVILPMRDTTYDQYMNEPPLDTVVRDLVFRIDPPDLFKVIQARLDYIYRITDNDQVSYTLSNGMSVKVQKNELNEYFKYILVAIRRSRYVSKIFYKLSNRNIRLGIQLLEDFCKSGHISTEEILSIRSLEGEVELHINGFLNAIIRKNRKYYDGESSNIVNLFASNYNDDFPDPLVRVDILLWLKENMPKNANEKLPSVESLLSEMQTIGHELSVIKRELAYLIKRELINADSLSEKLENSDLLRLTQPGRMHLELLENITYLAACAENVHFSDNYIMSRISQRLKSGVYLSKFSRISTAKDLINYMVEYRKKYYSSPDIFMKEGGYKLYDFDISLRALQKVVDSDPDVRNKLNDAERYNTGDVVKACIKDINSCYLIVSFIEESNIMGYASINDPRCNLDSLSLRKFRIGDTVLCKIVLYDNRYFDYIIASVELISAV